MQNSLYSGFGLVPAISQELSELDRPDSAIRPDPAGDGPDSAGAEPGDGDADDADFVRDAVCGGGEDTASGLDPAVGGGGGAAVVAQDAAVSADADLGGTVAERVGLSEGAGASGAGDSSGRVAAGPDYLEERRKGYQLLHSKIAIASGGIWGYGFRKGPYLQENTLPERQNDFYFPIIAHQFGLVGCLGFCCCMR